jgi:hypothetical protein
MVLWELNVIYYIKEKSMSLACSEETIGRKSAHKTREIASLRKQHKQENHTLWASELLIG